MNLMRYWSTSGNRTKMTKMTFDRLINTRDLGGLAGAEGNLIVPGRLIRSGRLAIGSEDDIRKIGENVSVVVDFRSANERNEEPDPGINGVEIIHIPVIADLAAGVSRDSKSDAEAFMMLVNDPDGAFDYMCRNYESFVTSAAALAGYRKFIDILLEEREKAVLWHCTAGKDRAGFASAIVLEILGADRDPVMNNYLLTNELIKEDIQRMVGMFFEKAGDRMSEQALRNMFEARTDYLNAAYDKAQDIYGDFRGYLIEGLRITDAEIQKMRRMYLE